MNGTHIVSKDDITIAIFVCAKRRHFRFISIDHTRCPLFHSEREHQNERKRQKDNEKAYFLLAQMAKSEAQLLP